MNRITDFVVKYKIIDNRQYGFQKGKTVNQLLGKFSDHFNKSMSQNLHSLVLFLDFSKAFDTISHAKLLDALEAIGICGNCHKLLKSYLQNRHFKVKVDSECSKLFDIECGVPQGSKLGPLLFLIYSNNLLKQLINNNYIRQ